MQMNVHTCRNTNTHTHTHSCMRVQDVSLCTLVGPVHDFSPILREQRAFCQGVKQKKTNNLWWRLFCQLALWDLAVLSKQPAAGHNNTLLWCAPLLFHCHWDTNPQNCLKVHSDKRLWICNRNKDFKAIVRKNATSLIAFLFYFSPVRTWLTNMSLKYDRRDVDELERIDCWGTRTADGGMSARNVGAESYIGRLL